MKRFFLLLRSFAIEDGYNKTRPPRDESLSLKGIQLHIRDDNDNNIKSSFQPTAFRSHASAKSVDAQSGSNSSITANNPGPFRLADDIRGEMVYSGSDSAAITTTFTRHKVAASLNASLVSTDSVLDNPASIYASAAGCGNASTVTDAAYKVSGLASEISAITNTARRISGPSSTVSGPSSAIADSTRLISGPASAISGSASKISVGTIFGSEASFDHSAADFSVTFDGFATAAAGGAVVSSTTLFGDSDEEEENVTSSNRHTASPLSPLSPPSAVGSSLLSTSLSSFTFQSVHSSASPAPSFAPPPPPEEKNAKLLLGRGKTLFSAIQRDQRLKDVGSGVGGIAISAVGGGAVSGVGSCFGGGGGVGGVRSGVGGVAIGGGVGGGSIVTDDKVYACNYNEEVGDRSSTVVSRGFGSSLAIGCVANDRGAGNPFRFRGFELDGI